MKTTRVNVAGSRKTLEALHTLTFPGDEQPLWDSKGGFAWAVYDGPDPVAFLFCHETADDPRTVYFSRVGVMPAARGLGFQRRLMRTMVSAMRKAGYKTIVSTTYSNPASANNFVREQWMTYIPAHPWGSPDTIYWRKDLC